VELTAGDVRAAHNIALLRSGFVPAWANDLKIGGRTNQ
jgi:hypothetical protein